jgi:hypothetical protein
VEGAQKVWEGKEAHMENLYVVSFGVICDGRRSRFEMIIKTRRGGGELELGRQIEDLELPHDIDLSFFLPPTSPTNTTTAVMATLIASSTAIKMA